eukprot:c16158_g1_i1.p1 GENE.c16158_g1_i1~~c16158_g1_i1.p1  ORF type:complete len:514 (+),score=96.25 c16158_g1_i1:32-1573(+)
MILLASLVLLVEGLQILHPTIDDPSIDMNVLSTRVGRQTDLIFVANLTKHKWESLCSTSEEDREYFSGKIVIAKSLNCEPTEVIKPLAELGAKGIFLLSLFPFIDQSFCTNCRFDHNSDEIPVFAVYHDDLQHAHIFDLLDKTYVTVKTTLSSNGFGNLHKHLFFIIFWRAFIPALNLIGLFLALRNLYLHLTRSRQHPQLQQINLSFSVRVYNFFRSCRKSRDSRQRSTSTESKGRKYDFSVSTVPRLALIIEACACVIRIVYCACDPMFSATGVLTYAANSSLSTVSYPLHTIVNAFVFWFFRRIYVALDLRNYHWLGHVVDPKANLEKYLILLFSFGIICFDVGLGVFKGTGWGHADSLVIQIVAYTIFELINEVVLVWTIGRVVFLLVSHRSQLVPVSENIRNFLQISTRWIIFSVISSFLIFAGAILISLLRYTPVNFFIASGVLYFGFTMASLSHVVALTPVTHAPATGFVMNSDETPQHEDESHEVRRESRLSDFVDGLRTMVAPQ